MSDDDEVPPMGGMEEDGSDDADMDDNDYAQPVELPDGIKKEIITAAPEENWKTPKNGDEVTVHYVGTLESDGSEFDSSRKREQPFVFTLGKGQVIKGWDIGVATMKKGELAKFILAPEFAYGDSGSPPKIPEKSTLVFEVELISWVSKDDLFGDEGVIKTLRKEGSGWKKPKLDGEVLVSLKVVAADGVVVEERLDFEYTLGSNSLGTISKVCDKALEEMKKGEEAELKCSSSYAYGEERPDGATITLTLQQIYEKKDVSFTKDKSVMKKAIKEGSGHDTPKDASKAKLSVIAATDGSAPLPHFEAKELEFIVGNGEVCDAIECAVAEMKKEERAEVTVSNVVLAIEPQIGLKDLTADRVVLTLELLEFENPKDTWSLSEEERVEFGTKRKDMGSIHFKNGRLQLALQRYKKVADMFNHIDNFKEETKGKANELKKICDLNLAACHLKLKNYMDAKTVCAAVLKDDIGNIKGLYRHAQAECGLKNFLECISDCKKIITANPQNKEARALLREALAGQKLCDKQSKDLFANMCKALGKGPIPEPFKAAKRRHEDMDEDEEESDGDEGMDTADGEEETKADAEAAAAAAAVSEDAVDKLPDAQMQDSSDVGQVAAAAAA